MKSAKRKLYRAKWREANRKKTRAQQRALRSKPEYKLKAREYAKNYHARPEVKARTFQKQRANQLQRCYGLTGDQYQQLVEAQHGVCAICKQSEKTKRGHLHVDHNHTTGATRGLLCSKCNTSIGLLSEKFSTIQQAAAYLMRHDPQRSWDTYFIEIARLVSTRSKDPSSQVGAVITIDKTIISTGYNGIPRGLNDKIKERYEAPLKEFWMCHAEENALLNASRNGIKCEGGSLYVTPFQPCTKCALMAAQCGIKEIVVDSRFDNTRLQEEFEISKQILNTCGVIVRPPE
jgi:dCMP deaminase